jgi:hypothetical protein
MTHADLDPTNRCTATHGTLKCTLHEGHKRSHYDSLADRSFRKASTVQPFMMDVEGFAFTVFATDPREHSFTMRGECSDPEIKERAMLAALDRLAVLDR